MSLASFYFGLAQLVLVGLALGFFAWRLRSKLIPSYDGPVARLAEIVIGIATLILITEALGVFGLLRGWAILLASLLCALTAWLKFYPGEAKADMKLPSPPISVAAGTFAAVIAALLVAQWGAFTSYSLDHGITNFDSVWYHMPFAAEMARSGSSIGFHHTETVFLNWFYPQNSEIVHAAGIALSGRDFVSVFLNLGWLGIAMLAGWCVGRPYGRPHLTMVAAAILLVTHTLVAREPGTGKNDIVAIALTISMVAFVINRGAVERDCRGRISPGWVMALGGLTAGLAAGTKVTALAPVLMVTFAVLFATVDGKRLRAAGVWFASAFVGGAFWYLRSLFASGSPLPQIESLGPLNLPGPERLQVGRPDFTVLHYATDLAVWRDYFLPGLEKGFGVLWPLLITMAIVGLVALMFRGPGRLTRAHGLAALLAIAAYLVTPLGAAGPEGEPTAFAVNLRFLVPALIMALVLVPLLPWFDRAKPRFALGVAFLALFLAAGHSDAIWSQPGKAFGVACALATVVLPALLWTFRDRLRNLLHGHSATLPAALLAGLVALLAAGPLSTYYFDSRYNDFEPESGLAGPYRWAAGISDSHIGLAGSTAGFKQYGFFGSDLSNEVTYIGREAGGGGFEAIRTCAGFRNAVNDADLDFLITSSYLNFNDYEHPISSPERSFVEGDPSVTRVAGASQHPDPDRIQVWRINGPLDPGGCLVGEAGEYVPGLKDPAAQ
ncbi:MAG: hypothetical protein WBP55_03190 [Solirubrobacterales bacterium]